MRRSTLFFLGAVLALSLGIGCASRAGKAGLANAPGGTRPWTSEDRNQDAVANGPGSCPEEGKADPLPNRYPPCAESSAKPARPAASGR